MVIRPAYSCMLGRPWIHAASLVPSSLHQKLKFIVGDKLVIISGEEDLVVACPKPAEHIKANEEALETAFQSKGYKVGRGLGKNLDGIIRPVQVMGNSGKLGLGYQPHGKTLQKMPIKGQRRIGHLWEHFVSKGFANQVEEETGQQEMGPGDYVHLDPDQTGTVNWTILDIPVVHMNHQCYNILTNECNETEIGQDIREELEGIDKTLGPLPREVETINSRTTERREIKVGTTMHPEIRKDLIQLLKEYVDIFA
ncbi:hypothetical protein CR513_57650, partial [Mucuna pruriens]